MESHPTPRGSNLHPLRSVVCLSTPKRHPDNADASPPPSGYRFSVASLPQASGSYCFRFRPRTCLTPNPLPPLLACSLHLPTAVLFLDNSQQAYYDLNHMTAYTAPLARTTPEAVRAAKEKRRQVLEAAARTRKANYEQFLKNRRLHTKSDLV